MLKATSEKKIVFYKRTLIILSWQNPYRPRESRMINSKFWKGKKRLTKNALSGKVILQQWKRIKTFPDKQKLSSWPPRVEPWINIRHSLYSFVGTSRCGLFLEPVQFPQPSGPQAKQDSPSFPHTALLLRMESSLQLLPGSAQVGQGKLERVPGGGAGFSVYS